MFGPEPKDRRNQVPIKTLPARNRQAQSVLRTAELCLVGNAEWPRDRGHTAPESGQAGMRIGIRIASFRGGYVATEAASKTATELREIEAR